MPHDSLTSIGNGVFSVIAEYLWVTALLMHIIHVPSVSIFRQLKMLLLTQVFLDIMIQSLCKL